MKHLFKHLLNHETIQLIMFDTKHDKSPLNDMLKRLFVSKHDTHHCLTAVFYRLGYTISDKISLKITNFFGCCHNVSGVLRTKSSNSKIKLCPCNQRGQQLMQTPFG